MTEDMEQVRSDRQREQVVAALRPLPIFAPLSDEQIARLADHAAVRRFYTGEVLVQQGAEGDSLYVVMDGKARVEFRNVRGEVQVLAIREPGEFFGEMSLLTGERRSASVVAESDMLVGVVDRAAFAPVLSGDLSSLQMLSEIVQGRLEGFRQLEVSTATPEQSEVAGSLIGRIARFLGLG
jgi:CRP-like cAMP-binding protein